MHIIIIIMLAGPLCLGQYSLLLNIFMAKNFYSRITEKCST